MSLALLVLWVLLGWLVLVVVLLLAVAYDSWRRQRLLAWHYGLAQTPPLDGIVTYADIARALDPQVVAEIERRRDARPLTYTLQPQVPRITLHDGEFQRSVRASCSHETVTIESWSRENRAFCTRCGKRVW